MMNFFLTILLLFPWIQSSTSTPLIRLKKHSDGYTNPLAMIDPNDGTDRFFVVERDGLVVIVTRDGMERETTPFLDVSGLFGDCTGYCAERGLLGFAFHPNFPSNDYFYINYTQQDDDGQLWTIVSRFQVDSSNSNVADATSEVILLQFEQPFSNHNGGDMKFGPDGYLYIASGDGGSAGDPEDNGQDLTNLLGKILRIDVDNQDTGLNYAIPPTNPFINDASTPSEIWSYGLRNPWRISFDSMMGDLYIADVGQNIWEEVNYQPALSAGGENYGWRLLEGTHCYDPEVGCEDGSETLTYPFVEYEHVDGACSVTGGYVYRGSSKGQQGTYYYGDFCNGHIWGAKMTVEEDGLSTWSTKLVKPFSGLLISSFAEDKDNNLYVISLLGDIYKVVKCKDNPKFFFKKEKKTCKWIGKKQIRIDNLCSKTSVAKNCKKACGCVTK